MLIEQIVLIEGGISRKEVNMMIRTIDQAYDELKKRDPDTAISRHMVRQLVKTGIVPSIQSGNKKLVDVDVLEQYVADMTKGVA